MPAAVTDNIAYTEPFQEHVQGRLKAQFHLGANGQPEFDPHPDDTRLRVYTIDVFLDSPRAPQIKKVEYLLDDPTFEDDKGWSTDRDNQFREEISTYGDVEIEVTVTIDGHKYKQRAWLSHMLENGHATTMTPTIRSALESIRAN